MKSALALASILLVITVFLSGCTSETPVANTASSGLTVEYVRASMNYVKSGDSITIEAKAQNNGDRNINLVTAVPIYLAWPGFSSTYPCYNLERPNAELERQGGICPARWTNVRAPKVTKAETYDVGVRFYYDYSTVAKARVFAMTGNHYMGYKERGETVPTAQVGTASGLGTQGPIQVDIKIDNVIIIPSMGASSRRVPVTLVFTNAGGGYPQAYGTDARSYKISSVTIDTEYTGGMYVDNIGSCGGEVSMRGGSSGECIFWLSVPSSTSDEIYIDLKLTVNYPYYVQSTDKITVNPDVEDIYN